ncbi:MAG: hypothetical protein V7739_18835 [Motiliproteus sp.]
MKNEIPMIHLVRENPLGITGILKNWCIHRVDLSTLAPKVAMAINNLCDEEGCRPLIAYGEVVMDFKGRFPPGTAIHTSNLIGLNLESMTLKTLNSTYQLQGPGLIQDKTLDQFKEPKPMHAVLATRYQLKQEADPSLNTRVSEALREMIFVTCERNRYQVVVDGFRSSKAPMATIKTEIANHFGWLQ